jgi:RimJ/RimL family protein N-acetyltransferase
MECYNEKKVLTTKGGPMSESILKNGKTLTVRPAVSEDAAGILAYLKVAGSESGNLTFGQEGLPLTLEQETEHLAKLAGLPTSALLIAVMDGEIVGSLSLAAPVRERLKHNADLGISVRQSCWNQGVGSALMTDAIAFAKATGVLKILHLSVRTDNVHAIRLYKKFGFREIGLYERYLRVEDVYYDTLLMNLFL